MGRERWLSKAGAPFLAPVGCGAVLVFLRAGVARERLMFFRRCTAGSLSARKSVLFCPKLHPACVTIGMRNEKSPEPVRRLLLRPPGQPYLVSLCEP